MNIGLNDFLININLQDLLYSKWNSIRILNNMVFHILISNSSLFRISMTKRRIVRFGTGLGTNIKEYVL